MRRLLVSAITDLAASKTLEEPLGEGIPTGHPSMPDVQIGPDQIDFIAFRSHSRARK
jgi:hypothetical protein